MGCSTQEEDYSSCRIVNNFAYSSILYPLPLVSDKLYYRIPIHHKEATTVCLISILNLTSFPFPTCA